MFRMTPDPTFNTEVELHIAGSQTPGKVTVTFKYLNVMQLAAWQKKYGRKDLIDALIEIIGNWDGPVDSQENPVSYTPENLKQLCNNYTTAAVDISEAFLREILGARRKN